MTMKEPVPSQVLAAAITKSASKQTYYTIRLFADRDRVEDAYRAYGYFRWVDDILDAEAGPASVQGGVETSAKIAFVNRQKSLLEACYRGEIPNDLCAEEQILVDLVRSDSEENSGLQSYLGNMMAVMDFDVLRRGRVISQVELSEYSQRLAIAVTEAMHYFIGHDTPTPCYEARYLAVTAAHITHMLRDALEDTQAGYFNIPGEFLQARGISPQEVNSPAYREWVRGRVGMARRYFSIGRECIARVKNLRCRLAGFAYAARFEWMLGAIERENYTLRPDYPDRKGLLAGLWMGWATLKSLLASFWTRAGPLDLKVHPIRMREL
jgi:phytoene/squalene synthetase